MIVILDNGHGKETQGKRSPVWPDGSQLLEWEFNRDIVQRLVRDLTAVGIKSHILVPESDDVILSERVRRANQVFANNNHRGILISIHANAGGGTGWECFTRKNSSKSNALAKTLFDSAAGILPFRMRKGDDPSLGGPKKAEFHILRCQAPCVLTENLFMDTWEDCKFLMSEEGRRAITRLHFDAIVKYLQK
jgi:N-acetylmuramoyl-L-alanine amidase